MSWLGKFVGGAFGFLLGGGPLGAILGAAIGHQFDLGIGQLDDKLHPGDQHRVQMAFFTATFSIMGHIAKADGQVSSSEISLANRIMTEMALSEDMKATARNLFQQGKQANFPLADALFQFKKECHRRTQLIRMFLEIQIQAALADGQINSAEDRLLIYICQELGVSRFEYERLKIQLFAQQRFYYQYEGQTRGQQSRPINRQSNLAAAYEILGVSSSASEAEIKKAYRRLMSQHHPDKLVAKGLPEEMMSIAKEKTQKIRKAYETIMEARK